MGISQWSFHQDSGKHIIFFAERGEIRSSSIHGFLFLNNQKMEEKEQREMLLPLGIPHGKLKSKIPAASLSSSLVYFRWPSLIGYVCVITAIDFVTWQGLDSFVLRSLHYNSFSPLDYVISSAPAHSTPSLLSTPHKLPQLKK